MAEQNAPAVANELVEVDLAIGGVGIEIWSSVAETKRPGALF